jgi:menaquinone-dependent protoporphyrinogen oxidase
VSAKIDHRSGPTRPAHAPASGSSPRVLVAYASEHGGTAEIAAAIGEELRTMGITVEVRPVDEVEDVGPFDAVLLGSALYYFHWRRSALRFGRKHAPELRQRAVWLFDSGPLDLSAEGGETPPAKAAEELAKLLQARGRMAFGGRLLPERAGYLTRKLMEGGKAGHFGDYRNLPRVRAWARKVGEELVAGAPIPA